MNYGQGSGYVKRNSPQFAFNRACFPTPVGSLVGPLIGGRSSSSISMRGRRMRRGSCNMRATNSSSEVLSRPMSTEQLESAQREQGFRKKASRCRQTADFERYARRAILHQIINRRWRRPPVQLALDGALARRSLCSDVLRESVRFDREIGATYHVLAAKYGLTRNELYIIVHDLRSSSSGVERRPGGRRSRDDGGDGHG